MGLCEQYLNSHIQSDCNNPSFEGYERKGWIINKSDVANYKLKEKIGGGISVTLESLTLKEGAQAFNIISMGTQPTPSKVDGARGTFTSYFTNGITLVLLNRTPNVVEDIVIPMNSGLEVVVILQPKQKNTDGTPMFEVYGLTKGLTGLARRDEYNADLQGGWEITLTEENAPVPFHFITDQSIVEGLETPAV